MLQANPVATGNQTGIADKISKPMKFVTIGIFLLSLLLLRPYALQGQGMMYAGDDESYLAHATALAFGRFPDYRKEAWTAGQGVPLHSIGAGLMAAPFVFLFSLIDRVQGAEVVKVRTLENVRHSWAGFGFIVATQFYFWLACLFLFLAARGMYGEAVAALAVIFVILCQGVPLYALRRPFFTHIYELFLQSICVYWLIRGAFRPTFGAGNSVALGGVLGLMALVRQNNLPSALLWPLVLVGDRKRYGFPGFPIRRLLGVFSVAFALWAVFKLLPAWANAQMGGHGQYESQVMNILLNLRSLDQYPKYLFWVLVGYDWGLVFTAPFVLLGFYYTFRLDSALRASMLLLWLPSLFNLFIVLQWGTHGSWYGYRYLLFMLFPLAVVPVCACLQRGVERWGMRRTALLFSIIAFFPFLSMISFEGNGAGLSLYREAATASHVGGWRNERFQLEVWRAFIVPKEFFGVIAKGALHYFVYVPFALVDRVDLLPAMVREKYPEFSALVLGKTLVLYSLPFLFHALARKFGVLTVKRD
jgi:hypothetical protein